MIKVIPPESHFLPSHSITYPSKQKHHFPLKAFRCAKRPTLVDKATTAVTDRSDTSTNSKTDNRKTPSLLTNKHEKSARKSVGSNPPDIIARSTAFFRFKQLLTHTHIPAISSPWLPEPIAMSNSRARWRSNKTFPGGNFGRV